MERELDKTERISLQLIVAGLLIGPIVGFLYLFSVLGSGPRTYEWVTAPAQSGGRQFYPLTGVYAGILFLLYLCDAFLYWTTPKLVALRQFLLAVAAIAFVLSTIFVMENYAYMPICLYLLGLPPYITAIFRVGFHSRISFQTFVGFLRAPMIFCGLFVIGWWCFWMLGSDDGEDRFWDKQTSLDLASKSACKVDEKEIVCDLEETFCNATTGVCTVVEDAEETYETCLVAFVVWVMPMVVAFSTIFFGFVCAFLQPGGAEGQQHISPKFFAQLMILMLFALWCAASLSSAAPEITEAFVAFTMVSVIAIGMLVVGSYGVSRLVYETNNNAFVKDTIAKYSGYGDMARGMFVWTSMPLYCLFLVISALNQCVRKASCFPYSKEIETEEERAGIFTETVQHMYERMKNWRWTSVLKSVLLLGTAYMALNVVVAKFTTLLLSWLITECSAMGLYPVTGIIIAIGLFLFLLPPVPGVPIYLTGGILLVASGRYHTQPFALGIWGSVVYTGFVSLAIKLFACTLQQKCIGGFLAGKAWIRQLVGVNSDMIRTMKLILGEPGLGLAKVAILVGGPDWPTSVLCGIMGLKLGPVLVGTLPVWALIWPTVLSGTFLYLSGEKDWAGTAATIFLTATAAVQGGSLVCAAYYLDKKVEENKELLEDKSELDQEVLELDRQAEQKKMVLAVVSDWSALPTLARVTLISASVLMILSTYMITCLTCFQKYQVNYTIDCHLGGKWYRLVTWPYGWGALALWVLSVIIWYAFSVWEGGRVKKYIKEHGLPDLDDDAPEDALTTKETEMPEL